VFELIRSAAHILALPMTGAAVGIVHWLAVSFWDHI
jgi:hypothetical protein